MALEKIVREAQLGEIDSAAVSSSPDSFKQSATQNHSSVEEGLCEFSLSLINELARWFHYLTYGYLQPIWARPSLQSLHQRLPSLIL